MTAPSRLAATLPFVVVVSLAAHTRNQPLRSPELASDLSLHMQSHYAEAVVMCRAAIRGDLGALRAPAAWLAQHEAPAGLPDTAQPLLLAMQQAAQAAMNASDVAVTTRAVAQMSAACGRCHELSAAQAVLPVPDEPVVGGVVGHMLAHQRAVDQLFVALVEPSDALWRRGVEGLEVAPLKKDRLPRDRRLGDADILAEPRVHSLAARARAAASREERAAAFAEVVSSCASCHRIHAEIWGPGISDD